MSERPISFSAVYSARPTIQIDQQSYDKVSELLIGMDITEQEGGLSSLQLRLSNVASDPSGGASFAFEDGSIVTLGKSILVFAGPVSTPMEIFRGMITGVEAEFREEGPPELLVLAEDAAQQARMARRTKTYDELSLADLAQAVADSLGLQLIVTGFSDRVGTWMQLNESDLAFLRRVLERYDGDVQVVGDELHVSPRDEVRRGTVELRMHSQLRGVRVMADLAHQTTKVTVAGWDVAQGSRLTAESTGAHQGPGEGSTGAEWLGRASIERTEHIGHAAVRTQNEAQALVDSTFDQRARRFVCLEGMADGNPEIRVGTHVTISEIGPRFSNTYYVTRATHRYDLEVGYRTQFEAECAYWGERA
ncbi:MAG: contractile injection system protein, VgrG/Pvc8 family [Nitrospira sp.]|nr:contractile injection system protein, VgrG/Pvc8 family [Nitrospira sp.]